MKIDVNFNRHCNSTKDMVDSWPHAIKELIAKINNYRKNKEHLANYPWMSVFLKSDRMNVRRTEILNEATNLKEKADHWDFCYCGNLCEIIPRNSSNSRPTDPALYEMGSEFEIKISGAWHRIDDERYTEAIGYLNEAAELGRNMDERSTYIIEEQLKIEGIDWDDYVKINTKQL